MGNRIYSYLDLSEEIASAYKDHFFSNGVELLYHYTDLNGLLGIIQTNGFWATNYSYLNDVKEIVHGIEICCEIIEELEKNGPSSEEKLFLDEVTRLIHSDEQEIFIVSFCSKPDLLSQWRGYGGVQQGVSIGLRYKDVAQYTVPGENESFYIRKVIYDRNIQRQILEDVIAKGLEHVRIVSGVEISEQAQEVNMALKHFIALFKDDSFQEEAEWRNVTIYSKQAEQDHNIKFRVRNHYILPFIELPLYHQDRTVKVLPIREVVTAPPSDGTTIRSIRYLLEKSGYGDVNVCASSIPYRPV